MGVDVSRLLAPRSVAVVGATDRPAAYGSEALLNLRRWGFDGAVYAVNPGRSSVHGVACAPSLADLPEAPDAVVVAVPAAAAVEVVREAGALGCGGAVVFAAGWAEARTGGADQAALAAAAGAHDLPVCGPNGNGIVSVAARAPLWGDMVAPAPAGSVGLVSASGNVAVNALGSARGLRLHTVVSCGNGAVLGPEAFLAALAELEGLRAVALYLEADGDGEAWCAAFERCARAGVGVAVLKAGASAAGAAAAQAHTAAVAGDQRVFRAFVQECGAAWAHDVDELLELAKALAVAGRRRAPRPGVAVMTCSGGDAAVTGDLAEALGVPLPALAPATRRALEAVLPGAASARNPLDYTSLLWEDGPALRALVRGLAADPAVGQLLVLFDRPPSLDGDAGASWDAVLDAVRAGAAQARAAPAGDAGDTSPPLIAVASTLPELCDDATAAALQADGLPATAGLRPALRVAAALAAPPPDPERIRALAAAVARARTDGNGWVAEHDAKAMLAAAGLPVPPGRVVAGPADAVGAWRALGGGAVAVKASAAGLTHKSELGAVVLGAADEAAVQAAAARVAAAVPATARAEVQSTYRGPSNDKSTGPPAAPVVLVERMAAPGAELLVAARADGVVPVLVVGLGGVWAEVLDDVALVPLPAAPERVERALRSLRGAALLTGGRGRPALDVAAAARLAAAAGDVLLDRGLALLELNPVIVHDRSATVADALARGGRP